MNTIKFHWEKVNGDTKLTDREVQLLASLAGEQKLDLDAGQSADNEITSVTVFISHFRQWEQREAVPYYRMDFGVIRNIRKVKFILNGEEIGMTNSRHTEAVYFVPGKLIQKENTLLAVVVDGSAAPIWIKGIGRKDYLPKDYCGEHHELPKTVKVEVPKAMPPIVQFQRKNNHIILQGREGESVLLEFWKGDIFRLRFQRADKEPMINSLCLNQLQQNLIPNDSFSVEERKQEMVILAENMVIHIQKSPFSLRVYREGTCMFHHLPDPAMCENGCGMQIALQEGESIYGLGENATPAMNKRGSREDIWTSHDWIHCDIPVPFYISTAGYGVYLNNSYHSYFDMGAMERDKALIWALGGELDYFFIPGEPKAVLAGYSDITGRAKLPPRWAFGFFQSKTGKDSTDMIRDKIQRFHENEIPLDVISIDPDWQNEFNDMEWNRSAFPDTAVFMKLLEENALHVMLWSSPFVTEACGNYKEGREAGYFLKQEDGTFLPTLWWKDAASGAIDFSNQEACKWWIKLMGQRLAEGADIFKIDGGDGGEIPVHAVNAWGRSGAEFHNLYPVLYAKAVYEGLQEQQRNKRVMVWERTGFVGSGRYPCTWGGDQPADFTGTQVLIKGGQQAGLAGIFFWAPDVGGFGENSQTSMEFFVRSYQWGALAPLARGHGNKTEPYEYGPEACAIVKKYLQLRYQLLPYLYSMAFKAMQESVPVMRAMYLEYPKNKVCAELEYQYFLGDFLMLAPIHKASGQENLSAAREICYPDEFIDFWTEERIMSDEVRLYHAELDILPIFVRRGAIIPMLRGIKNTKEYTGESYLLHLYPAEQETQFTLYFDDGVTLDYEKGIYDAIEIRCVRQEDGVWLTLHTVSDHMGIPEIQFEILIHEFGTIRQCETIYYKKQELILKL